ncbi:hypothetical protein MRX96_012337 [Rhipicephalus microplus]
MSRADQHAADRLRRRRTCCDHRNAAGAAGDIVARAGKKKEIGKRERDALISAARCLPLASPQSTQDIQAIATALTRPPDLRWNPFTWSDGTARGV